jgi:hypothetical protein
MGEEYPRLLPDYGGYKQRFEDKAASTKPESNRK